jgi:hypothetical protein
MVKLKKPVVAYCDDHGWTWARSWSQGTYYCQCGCEMHYKIKEQLSVQDYKAVKAEAIKYATS